jgi:hypothetical protein
MSTGRDHQLHGPWRRRHHHGRRPEGHQRDTGQYRPERGSRHGHRRRRGR